MMTDEQIRNALHDFAGDYDTLNRLLDCYEDWGARRATEERCGCLTAARVSGGRP
jgi:hypothetical protein